MLKKFVSGLVFGAGFGIALIAVWVLGISYVLPKVLETEPKEPKFENPHSAEIAVPDPASASPESKSFNFFKHARARMEIPENGGILAMSPAPTPSGVARPHTYQLWLTHTELWQIRTVGEKTEIEKLPYPDGASAETLDTLMRDSLGFAARQSAMTVSSMDIGRLKSGENSYRDDSLNGEMKITVEGVVFILPNQYQD